MEGLINLIKQRIIAPLPGVEAQYKMAPVTRARFDIARLDPNTYRKSAVMLLLYKNGNDVSIPLIKRHVYDGKHSGQIGLPGGKHDIEDGELVNTALRELYEEIGVSSDLIEVIGSLTPVYIPVSNFYVQPYIGVCDLNDVRFEIDAREVNKLISLNVETLKDDTIITEGGIVSGDGYKLKTPYFSVEGEIIWGATAMILYEFKTLIT